MSTSSQSVATEPVPTQSGCCGSSDTGTATRTQGTSCCGDPTPNPMTGACCSSPADSCSCRSS